VILGVGDDDGIVYIDTKVFWAAHARLQGGSVGCMRLSGSGNRENFAMRADDSERVSLSGQDVEIPVFILGHSPWIDQRADLCDGSILGDAPFAIARSSVDEATGEIDEADPLVFNFGDVESFLIGT
jgi:hypothetical protein